MTGEGDDRIEVRGSTAADAGFAEAAAALIAEAAADHLIAQRSSAMLRDKIVHGRAVLALRGAELVGFGFWSEWEHGAFVSHSGLVVRPDMRGRHLGRRLKIELFECSRRARPHATLMSLSSSAAVQAMNRALGFEVVPLEELTRDPGFWEGCKGCRSYAEMLANKERCSCVGMVLRPVS